MQRRRLHKRCIFAQIIMKPERKPRRPRKPAASRRRQPQQPRALHTVTAMLDAVLRILRRHGGLDAVTTNRIAEVAGVSIGSVYQYFPDKRAIFLALHERHVDEVSRLVERTLVDHADAPLAVLLRALVDALVDLHARDPELHELLLTVPHRSDGTRDFAVRLRGALRLTLEARAYEIGVADVRAAGDLERVLFVVSNLLDGLCHAAALRRPSRLSLSAAKDEVVRAILAYLRAP
jgi:AcrR family transcriptional regulator